jgi:uncharacterized protein (TIGR00369 family)
VAAPQVGYFHTGATSAIADSAGGYAAFTLFSENTSVLTVEYKINLLAPALGDHIEALGTVLKSGRTLTVCRLEVFGVKGRQRSLVAAGQQTLICVNQQSRQCVSGVRPGRSGGVATALTKTGITRCRRTRAPPGHADG